MLTLFRTFTLSVAAVILLGLASTGASANSGLQGTFTLPAQVYWGNTLLQPGQYTISMHQESATVGVIYIRGEGVSTTFASTAAIRDRSGHSYLRVDDLNGTYVVRELNSGMLGESFAFDVGKAVKDKVFRAAAQPVTIPISAGAGF